MKENSVVSIGLMSGTSLDGLDIAMVQFDFKNEGLKSYSILKTQYLPYDEALQSWLKNISKLFGQDLIVADRQYGTWLGKQVNAFRADIRDHQVTPTIVASHGHTIFHEPAKGYTLQIGHGAYLAATCHLPVVCDFRSGDVAYGGQGAPLVPIGDRYLYADYTACLNLGGIANISIATNSNKYVAFDITVANMALNDITHRVGLPFDKDGLLAQQGNSIPTLLEQLNNLPYLVKKAPKSISREWYMTHVKPLLLDNYNASDIAYTLCQHIGFAVAQACLMYHTKGQLIVTGGGAFHPEILLQIKKNLPQWKIIIPDEKTIVFKEAIIFALLGALRWLNMPNTSPEVTGAQKSLSSGCIYLP